MSALAFNLDLSRRAEHRIAVRLCADLTMLPRVDDGAAVELFLPAWTPGSYLIRDYARHLEGVTAVDRGTGAAVPCAKVAKNRFRIEPGPECAEIAVDYVVYAHELTVRTADVTAERAYWNGACVLLWPVGGERLPAEIAIDMPAGWRAVTQLPRLGEARFAAPDLDAAVDAPVLCGAVDVREFEALGKPHAFAFDGLDGIEPPEEMLDDTRRIIAAAAAVFGGELPYRRYDFIALFAGEGRGGLEHTESSTLLAPRTTFRPRRQYESFMGLVAHEFFHVWNVKRMRPAELWQFDYERENYTTMLWVAEGMTAYYDDLLCVRAGVVAPARYLEILAENYTAMRRTPGRLLHPLSQASFDAWIKLYRPGENSRNSTQSYYTHGALAALCFDLRIRSATDGRASLDDAMRALYAKTYGEGRGYRREDVVDALRSCAPDAGLPQLIDQLIDQPFDPDLGSFVAAVALRLVPVEDDGPYLGVQLRAGELVVASVLRGGPAMTAGLSPGDELLALDGLRVRHGNWSSVLKNVWSPGSRVAVLLARRGKILELQVEPEQSPAGTWRLEADPDASAGAHARRLEWLGHELDPAAGDANG